MNQVDESGRQAWSPVAERRNRLQHMSGDERLHRPSRERVSAGEHLVRHHTPRVDVGPMIHLVADRLLGREVRGRA